MKKEDLRKKYKEKRNQEKNIETKSQIIVDKIRNTNIYKNAKTIALYSSINKEVDLNSLFLLAKKDEKIIVYPRVIKKKEMVFIKIDQEADFEISNWQIKEPIYREEKIVKKENIDLIIVPGICFDRNKNRVGYGGGYYDKYLGNSGIIKIGVTYDSCLINDVIETETTDIKMDYIVTEKEIY